MENESSFEKNMREKFLGFTEEPSPRIWENVLAEIEKPQSVTEIIFPWAGPGLDVLVAILLIFQLNIPGRKMVQPALVQNQVRSEAKQKQVATPNKEGVKILVQGEKGLSNITRTAEKKISRDVENRIVTHRQQNSNQGDKADNIAAKVFSTRESNTSEPIYSSNTSAGGDPSFYSSQQPTFASGSSLVSSGENNLQLAFNPATHSGRQVNESSEGIIRVGLPPLGLKGKESLKEIQGKGYSTLYATTAQLKVLPEDYSSGSPFRGESSKKWLLDIWYAPGLGFSQIEKYKPEVKGSYLQIRDSSESPVYFGSYGLTLGRKSAGNFYYAAGIQYTIRNEKFSGVYQWDEMDIKVDSIVHDEIVNSTEPKVVIVDYDTVILSSRKSKLLNHHVKFQTWEVPVKAGFRFDKENIVFSLQAGIIASWRTRVSGSNLDPVLMEEIEIRPGTERQFLMSGTLSAGVEWKLGHHLSLIAEPQYRYYFQSPYADTYPLSLQWQSLSLLSGLRVRF